jgi:hypothetical protein
LKKVSCSQDILEGIIPFDAFATENIDMQRLILVWCTRNKLSDEIVGNDTDKHCDGKRDCSKEEGYAPLCATETDGGQSTSTNEYNNHLSANRDDIDTNEEQVPVNTFEDVELVVETAVANKT